ETQGRFVISSQVPERVLTIARDAGISCTRIGTVRSGSDALAITLAEGVLRAPRSMMRRAYHDTIPGIMSRAPERAQQAEIGVGGH
ncbi:MAG TPA: hypothetical protein VNO75_10320, partial [Gemmatimonadaceae bacterium]|nr:hypothetical protein [Gemmatimonadaceae bacterium]